MKTKYTPLVDAKDFFQGDPLMTQEDPVELVVWLDSGSTLPTVMVVRCN